MSNLFPSPLIGLGFRVPIARWTLANLHRFDVLEVTVDHYVRGGEYAYKAIRNLVDRIPLVLHGVGLSIGTDVPLDEEYLDSVCEAIEDLKVPSYSEHLAWTKVPGIDLANLLPVPKTRAVADMLIPKIEKVQARLPVPCFNEAGATTPRKLDDLCPRAAKALRPSMRPGQQRPGNEAGGVSSRPWTPPFNEAGATTPRKPSPR